MSLATRVPKTENEILAAACATKEVHYAASVKKLSQLSLAKQGGDESKAAQLHHSLLLSLASLEFDAEQLKAIKDMNEEEERNYDTMQTQIAARSIQVKGSIAALKVELHQERIERTHKEECAAVAKTIHAFASREQSLKEIEALNQEIAALEQDRDALDAEQIQRSKQLSLFFHSLSLLKRNWGTMDGGSSTSSSSSAQPSALPSASPPSSPVPPS